MSDTQAGSRVGPKIFVAALVGAAGVYAYKHSPLSGPDCSGRTGGHTVELQAQWVTLDDRAPKVFWSHNGDEKPAEGLGSHPAQGRQFDGTWSRLVIAHCGDTLQVRMVGLPEATAPDGTPYEPQLHGACLVVDGDSQTVKTGKNCKATHTVA
jgi:hypothetical protein